MSNFELTFDLLFTIAAGASLLVLWLASAAVLPWEESELDQVEQELAGLLPLELFKLDDAFDPSAGELQVQASRSQARTKRQGALASVTQLFVQEDGHRVPRRAAVGRVLLGIGR